MAKQKDASATFSSVACRWAARTYSEAEFVLCGLYVGSSAIDSFQKLHRGKWLSVMETARSAQSNAIQGVGTHQRFPVGDYICKLKGSTAYYVEIC